MKHSISRCLVSVSFLLVSGAPLAALADAPQSTHAAAPAEDCLLRSQMRGWESIKDDPNSIKIMVSPGHGYKIGFLGGECRSLRFAGLGARLSSPSNSGCVSRGDTMVFSGNPVAERCVIDSIEKLPPLPDAPK